MATSSRQIGFAALAGVLFLALFLTGGATIREVLRDAQGQRESLDHSHQVIEALLQLRTSFHDAISSRNQALFGVPGEHAASLARARQEIEAGVDRLLLMLPEDNVFHAAAKGLSASALSLGRRLGATLRLQGSQGLDLPMLVRESAAERHLLLRQAEALIDRQRDLLAGYNTAYLARVQAVRQLFLALLGTVLLLAAAALWGLFRFLQSSAGRYNALAQAKRISDEVNAALAESRRRLLSVLDHALDPILLVDRDGRVQIANAAAARAFQLSLPEIIGSPMRSLVPAYGARSGEVRAHRADGTGFPAELSVGHYEEGGEDRAVCVLRDVTERHRLDEMKSEFVSTVSHELRTPLTSIRASLGLVLGGVAGDLPEEMRELLEIAHSNSERLVMLVNDILDIEKIEAGRLEFRRERVSARALLHQAVEANRAYAEQFRVRLEETDDGGADAMVFADAQRIQQVLANLLSNAAKFSPEGSRVEASLLVDAGNVTFRVRDHGKGVPREFRPRIFQRFAQADSSDVRRKGGTGLGLSISRSIVEHHAGSIGFEDAEGGGTRFHFTLPRLAAPEQAPPPAHGPGERRRVLIVEDDADVARLLQMLLDRHGWDSRIAHSAAETFAALDADRFDALTLDLMLPDEDGFSLLRRLRAREDGRALPVVVVSAVASQAVDRAGGPAQDTLHGDAMGVVDWLEKPIDQDRLRHALRHAMQAGSSRILHVEDDQDIRRVVSAVMGDAAEMVPARSLAEARARLAGEGGFALVIIDLELPDGPGLALMQDLRALRHPPPVLIFSASDADAEASRSVTATLVKSRTGNRELHDTIRHLIERPSPAPAPDDSSHAPAGDSSHALAGDSSHALAGDSSHALAGDDRTDRRP
ncbi:ATP-binding response regulator [Teichococcus aerofrigidensis]